jgi:hypothetical protein
VVHQHVRRHLVRRDGGRRRHLRALWRGGDHGRSGGRSGGRGGGHGQAGGGEAA